MNSLDLLLLTKNTLNVPIFGPIWNLIVSALGIVMDWIYLFLESMGIPNIGLAIILFTLITRIILFPTSIGQQKSQRMMRLMQPEMKAIQDKYKNKTDNASMMAQQAEMRALYEKYGTSMTGGCLPLLLQMPIIFALYRIIMNIPAYVPNVKVIYQNVVDSIGVNDGVIATLTEFANNHDLGTALTQARNFGVEVEGITLEAQSNYIVDFLYKLNPSQWTALSEVFTESADVINQAAQQAGTINSFLGLNLSTAPSAFGFVPNAYWLIPICAAAAQWLSTKIMQSQTQSMSQGNDQSQQMMQSMNIMMPIMTLWFTYTFAAGIGLYWIASSLFMLLQQLIMNWYFGRKSDDEMLSEAMEKANAKRAKKGLPPIDEKSVEKQIKSMQEKQDSAEKKRLETIAKQQVKTKESSDYYNQNDPKPGSLASKAQMVKKYNEKHEKK